MLASVFGEPALPEDCFAGCEAQDQQTAFAKQLAEDGHPPVRATGCRVSREDSYDTRMADADLYDYQLPPELIAQESLADRAAARLLVVDRATGSLEHRHIRDLPEILRPGDLVVVNDTRVVPARLIGRRLKTSGRWEGLFLRVDRASGAWELLANTRGRPEIGERVMLVDASGADAIALTLVGRAGGGAWLAVPDVVAPAATAEEILNRVGRVPLPGYIRGGAEQPGDRERYQTVFARQSGSAAAPTAGLHFTESLLSELAARGIGRASVTLHVGLDTFRPISVERIDDHPMHTEWCECPPETVAAVHETKARGGRVVAVGTTAARTLETAARGGTLTAWSGPTDLFIKPGFQFHAVDCLLTNFHMPRTTLMVLVSTFSSRGLIATAYEEAIRQRYRFLSYGDAMLIQ
jgi:S-adenosylmethionine:tRNA ribosyltransferase-isomerase